MGLEELFLSSGFESGQAMDVLIRFLKGRLWKEGLNFFSQATKKLLANLFSNCVLINSVIRA